MFVLFAYWICCIFLYDVYYCGIFIAFIVNLFIYLTSQKSLQQKTNVLEYAHKEIQQNVNSDKSIKHARKCNARFDCEC